MLIFEVYKNNTSDYHEYLKLNVFSLFPDVAPKAPAGHIYFDWRRIVIIFTARIFETLSKFLFSAGTHSMLYVQYVHSAG